MATLGTIILKWAKLKGEMLNQQKRIGGMFSFALSCVSLKPLTHLSATIGQIKAANDGVGHHEWDDVWAGHAGSFNSYCNVSEGNIIIPHTDLM